MNDSIQNQYGENPRQSGLPAYPRGVIDSNTWKDLAVACALFLSDMGSISYAVDPFGVSPPNGKKWALTFDDEFTQDRSIDTNKWNGGASNSDWCSLDRHGQPAGNYMFIEPKDNSCQNYYGGLTLSSTSGLEFRSPPWWKGDDGCYYGGPSAALQTGGTTARNAKFIQKFGYWEARFKVPHNTHGEGTGLHSDFWMHPIPEGLKSPTEWLPEINVGERPTWDANLDKANNQIYFGIHDYGPGGARKDNAYGGPYGTSPPTDLSADWHTYGLYWRDDGSGPYGSMQFYLDGKPLWSPYALSSSATNMASGIYIFLSLDNDNKGADWQNNPFCVQYVKVWRLDPSNPGSSGTPANHQTPATSGKPKYLLFWSESEKAGELAERVGLKGDGKTRLLGFGLPNPTYEIEAQLPNRIRSAFAAAREHDLAVMLHFDFHLAWKNRPDLWNWFDPRKPGYDPNNQYNVEWHGWDGPPNKVRYLNHGVLERMPPNMCFTSKRIRAEVTRIVSRVIGPVLREQIEKLQAEGKEALFAGVLVGLEPSIDDYSQPDPERTKMMKEDGVPATPLGYRALLDRGFSANHPPGDFRLALANIVQETVAFWCEQFVEAGIPAEELYPHVAAPAPIEAMNAPIWTAFNPYSRPGWTTYAVEVLGRGFKPLYDELAQHGNPAWAGVEANAGMPGSVVDWETYLAWHYNHGCVLVGVNMGATGEDLPRRLRDSAFSKEAIAAYHKFLKGQPLLEKPLSGDSPQVRIQKKIKRVREGIESWQRSGRDPSAVGKIMEGAQPLANDGKLEELEKLVDQALEILGETGQVPDTDLRK